MNKYFSVTIGNAMICHAFICSVICLQTCVCCCVDVEKPKAKIVKHHTAALKVEIHTDCGCTTQSKSNVKSTCSKINHNCRVWAIAEVRNNEKIDPKHFEFFLDGQSLGCFKPTGDDKKTVKIELPYPMDPGKHSVSARYWSELKIRDPRHKHDRRHKSGNEKGHNHRSHNHGNHNHGSHNHGDHNHGSYNRGSHNNGNHNHGSHNHGSHNHGSHNRGNHNHGNHNHGDHNGGHQHQGSHHHAHHKHAKKPKYVWSMQSAKCFEIFETRQPRIVGASDDEDAIYPLGKEPVFLDEKCVSIKLKDVEAGAKIFAYIDGETVDCGKVNSRLCVTFQLKDLSPGTYDFSVRAADGVSKCECTKACVLAGPLSDCIRLSYEPKPRVVGDSEKNGYVLKASCHKASKCGCPKISISAEEECECQSDCSCCETCTAQTDDADTRLSANEINGITKTIEEITKTIEEIEKELEQERKKRKNKKGKNPQKSSTDLGFSIRLANTVKEVDQPSDTDPKETYYFAAPAHFPIREFDAKGGQIEREGVVIYEDMEFIYLKDGNYKVCFNIGTPELPSEIRLQFQFRPTCSKTWYTISLPPICHKDEVACGLKCKTITITGHSRILAAFDGNIDAIRRAGTARFGYGLSGLSQNRKELGD